MEEGPGHIGHCKDFDFCPGWDGQPLRLLSRERQDASACVGDRHRGGCSSDVDRRWQGLGPQGWLWEC